MADFQVELRARERVLLRNLLPAEGDLTTIRVVRELRQSLEFTEDDLERLHIGPPCMICGEREGQHTEANEEDTATHRFVPNPQRIGWDQDCMHCNGTEKGHDSSEHAFESKDYAVPFTVGPKALSLVKTQLAELNQHKKMTEEFLDLYDLFYPHSAPDGAKPTQNQKKSRSIGRRQVK